MKYMRVAREEIFGPVGASFGGYKDSGIGRETHKVILDHYSQMENIIINLSDKPGGMYVK